MNGKKYPMTSRKGRRLDLSALDGIPLLDEPEIYPDYQRWIQELEAMGRQDLADKLRAREDKGPGTA